MPIRKRIGIVGTAYKIVPPHIAGSKRKAFKAHFGHKSAAISMYLQPNQSKIHKDSHLRVSNEMIPRMTTDRVGPCHTNRFKTESCICFVF